MTRALHLGSYFLFTTIVSSAIASLGKSNLIFLPLCIAIYSCTAITLAIALLTDEHLISYLKLKSEAFYAILISFVGSIILGGTLAWNLG